MPSTPDAIPLSVAQAIAQSSLASLEELRAARKEMREDQRAHARDIAALREQVAAMRTEVGPALQSYGRHLDRLQEGHAEALQEAHDAGLRAKATFSSWLTSPPVMAVLGAAGSALVGYVAHALGVL